MYLLLPLACNTVFHARMKHIEIDYHFLDEKVVRGDLDARYIASIAQLPYLLTKLLSRPQFTILCSKLLPPWVA